MNLKIDLQEKAFYFILFFALQISFALSMCLDLNTKITSGDERKDCSRKYLFYSLVLI